MSTPAAVRCMLPAACYQLHVVCCMLSAACCPLHGAPTSPEPHALALSLHEVDVGLRHLFASGQQYVVAGQPSPSCKKRCARPGVAVCCTLPVACCTLHAVCRKWCGAAVAELEKCSAPFPMQRSQPYAAVSVAAHLGGDQRHGTGTFRRGVCDDDAIGLVIVLQRVDLRRRRVHRPVQVTLDRAIGGGQNGSGEVEQRCAITECANGEIDAGGGFDLDVVAGDGDSDRGLVCRGLGDCRQDRWADTGHSCKLQSCTTCGAHDGRPDLEAGRRISAQAFKPEISKGAIGK